MIHIKHTVCGGVAFLYSHRPSGGELIMASEARLLTGETPDQHTPMVCGSCGKGVNAVDLVPGDEVKLGDGHWDNQPWA